MMRYPTYDIRPTHEFESADLIPGELGREDKYQGKARQSAGQIMELTEGLSLLHSNGLLYRNIKPANIFFRQGAPVLGDIGLLTRQEGAIFAGSPGFLAPSILSGKGSAERYSNCYALAKSIYCAPSGLGPEQFPFYTGAMTSEASLLMRAVMAVCNEKPPIHSAEELRAFLSSLLMIVTLDESLIAIAFSSFRDFPAAGIPAETTLAGGV